MIQLPFGLRQLPFGPGFAFALPPPTTIAAQTADTTAYAGWISLWQYVLIFGIAVFAVLAVVVTIGGIFDIQKMFKELARQRDRDA